MRAAAAASRAARAREARPRASRTRPTTATKVKAQSCGHVSTSELPRPGDATTRNTAKPATISTAPDQSRTLHPGPGQPGAERQGKQQPTDQQRLHQHERRVTERHELEHVGQGVASDSADPLRLAQESGQQPQSQRMFVGLGHRGPVLEDGRQGVEQ